MIVIDKTIISEDLLDKQFVCALDKCKGACCVEGDSGAPLEWEETAVLENIFENVKPYMREEGIKSVKQYGTWLIDSEGDFVTPLIDGVRQCAYVFFEQGIAKCAIERAYHEGKIDFRKPVSCHLYPVRITKHEDYDAVNYNRWEICSPACANGKQLGVPVFQFVKDALIRKYGEEWFKQLEGAAVYKEAEVK
ncbi:MAG TPA: DUF3109 family protein [Chitinophagales bacterium]|nr:DUF3109 family protein [Chitinophagales bacterium]